MKCFCFEKEESATGEIIMHTCPNCGIVYFKEFTEKEKIQKNISVAKRNKNKRMEYFWKMKLFKYLNNNNEIKNNLDSLKNTESQNK